MCVCVCLRVCVCVCVCIQNIRKGQLLIILNQNNKKVTKKLSWSLNSAQKVFEFRISVSLSEEMLLLCVILYMSVYVHAIETEIRQGDSISCEWLFDTVCICICIYINKAFLTHLWRYVIVSFIFCPCEDKFEDIILAVTNQCFLQTKTRINASWLYADRSSWRLHPCLSRLI